MIKSPESTSPFPLLSVEVAVFVTSIEGWGEVSTTTVGSFSWGVSGSSETSETSLVLFGLLAVAVAEFSSLPVNATEFEII